ncbi:MAG: RidA family protein [Acidimicrobiia bacterium]
MVEKILISSGSPFEQSVGFSRAVRVDDRILVAGTAPIWSDGGVDPDPGVQAARCLEIIGEALEDAGASFDDVVRTRTYLTNAADWEAVAAEHGKVFSEIRPASTMVVVVGMLDPRWKVEMEAEAVIG